MRSEKRRDGGAPLVVVGIDTFDVEAVFEWASRGELPAIASILNEGCWGTLTGPELVCEYGTGLSLLSGVSRAEHGYYYFRQLRPGTYDVERVKPPDFGAPPFWARLAGSERSVLIVDPPEADVVPGLRGYQLANWASHHFFAEATTSPSELLAEADRLVGRPLRIADISSEERSVLVSRLLARVAQKGKLCRELLARGDYDLVVAFFGDTDAASHLFWPYRTGAELGDSGAAILDVYRAVDRELESLLALVPETANVVLLSLYDIQDDYPTGPLLEPFCRQLDYQPVRRSLRPLSLARRVLPQALRDRLSLLLPAATQDSLLADKTLHDTDWSRTKAFAIPGQYTGFLRVNLHGREPMGIVSPGREYEEVLERLEGDLAALIDPVTGEPAVRRVARSVDLFGGGPPQRLPDLFVEWVPGAHLVERLVHPKAELTQTRPAHCPGSQEKLSGLFAAKGPSVQANGPVGEVSLLDVAPTCLRLLGESADGLAGREIDKVLGEPAASDRSRTDRR